MDNETLISTMGVCIALITGIATIITLAVGCYAIYLQTALVQKTKREFKEHFDEMLDGASKDPMILENFIKCIVEKDEFKNRFLSLMRTEMENLLDSRQTLEKQKQDTYDYRLSIDEQKAQGQFQEKE